MITLPVELIGILGGLAILVFVIAIYYGVRNGLGDEYIFTKLVRPNKRRPKK